MSTTLRSGSACPSCKTGRLVRIVYGLPGLDLRHDAEAGAVALGGCVVRGNDPELQCLGCLERFMRNGDWVLFHER